MQEVNIMIRRIKFLIGVCALCSSTVFAASCPDLSAYPLNGCSLPGLVDGSFPFFYQTVKVILKNKNDGDFTLKAKYGGVASRKSLFLFSPAIEDIYPINGTRLKFRARYRDGVLTGSIRIRGKMPGLNINKRQTLMTADLKGDWNSTGQLIGFNTTNIECNPAINAVAECTKNEVIYFSQLVEALDLGGAKGKYRTTGLAVTSVPVPSAAWLFGSGLVGLAGMARCKHA